MTDIRAEILKWAATDEDLNAMDVFDRVEMAAELEAQFGIDIYDDEMAKWTRIDHVVETIRAALAKNRSNSG
jgi:acyl carrier protein